MLSEHVAIFVFILTAFIPHLAKNNQHTGVNVRSGQLRQLRGPSSYSVTHQSLAGCSKCGLAKQLLRWGWKVGKGIDSHLTGYSAYLRVRRHTL